MFMTMTLEMVSFHNCSNSVASFFRRVVYFLAYVSSSCRQCWTFRIAAIASFLYSTTTTKSNFFLFFYVFSGRISTYKFATPWIPKKVAISHFYETFYQILREKKKKILLLAFVDIISVFVCWVDFEKAIGKQSVSTSTLYVILQFCLRLRSDVTGARLHQLRLSMATSTQETTHAARRERQSVTYSIERQQGSDHYRHDAICF